MKPLAVAEAAVRRVLLMTGLGFAAFVAGSIFAASFGGRVSTRLATSGETARTVGTVLVEACWVWLFLPALGYLSARFLEMRPWATGLIGAATGVSFQLALQYLTLGADGLAAQPARVAARIGAAIVGAALTALAVRSASEARSGADDRARAEAETKKAQYDAFVREAEALAERREQVPIAPERPKGEP